MSSVLNECRAHSRSFASQSNPDRTADFNWVKKPGLGAGGTSSSQTSDESASVIIGLSAAGVATRTGVAGSSTGATGNMIFSERVSRGQGPERVSIGHGPEKVSMRRGAERVSVGLGPMSNERRGSTSASILDRSVRGRGARLSKSWIKAEGSRVRGLRRMRASNAACIASFRALKRKRGWMISGDGGAATGEGVGDGAAADTTEGLYGGGDGVGGTLSICWGSNRERRPWHGD